MKNTLLYGLAALAAGCAAAQDKAPPNPADPGTAVQATTYTSAFEGYAGFSEQDPADWRQLNEEVGRAGGHAGIFGGGHGGHGAAKPPSRERP